MSHMRERTQYERNIEIIRALKNELDYRRPIRWSDLADSAQRALQVRESDPIDKPPRLGRAGRETKKKKGR